MQSGWVDAPVHSVSAAGDAEAVAAVRSGKSTAALVDAVYWARHIEKLGVVPGAALSTDGEAGDLILLSPVRLDELEAVSAPTAHRHTADEVVARVLTREYYGVESNLLIEGEDRGDAATGRLLIGDAALRDHTAPYVESLNQAWWLLTGLPLVRSVCVAPAADGFEAPALREVLLASAGVLAAQAESVAAQLRKSRGGSEERWLKLCRSIHMEVGAEERKGLSTLLGRASRMRMCDRVPEQALP